MKWRGTIIDDKTLRLENGKTLRYEVDDEEYATKYDVAAPSELVPGTTVTFEWEGMVDDPNAYAVELRVEATLASGLARLKAVGLLAGLVAPSAKKTRKKTGLLELVTRIYSADDAHERRKVDRVLIVQARRASADLAVELMDLAGKRVLTDLVWSVGRARRGAPTLKAKRLDGTTYTLTVDSTQEFVQSLSTELREGGCERSLAILQDADESDELVVLALTRPQLDALDALHLLV